MHPTTPSPDLLLAASSPSEATGSGAGVHTTSAALDPRLAISVENVSKLYRLGVKEDTAESIGGSIAGWLSSPLANLKRLRELTEFSADSLTEERDDILWALRDVSFGVALGDVVGIVGGNGAGKSTLLKVLARITRPSHGRVTLRGRVASLLEVGTGFHPDLSGRENVYLNGTFLGMTRAEVDSKFDEIVAFAQMERFIDTPTKRYSSGQRVRLAFAVAAHLEPEILLVDEVLAVGDMDFQRRCIGKMKDVASHGRTVLFVSHNISSIRALCTTGIFMRHGRMMCHGTVEEAVGAYLGRLASGAAIWEAPETTARPTLEILRVAVADADGTPLERQPFDEPYQIEFTTRCGEALEGIYYEVRILENDGNTLYYTRDVPDAAHIPGREPGTVTYRVRIPTQLLVPGTYSVSVRAVSARGEPGFPLPQVEGVCHYELFDSNSIAARLNLGWRGKVSTPITWQVRHEG